MAKCPQNLKINLGDANKNVESENLLFCSTEDDDVTTYIEIKVDLRERILFLKMLSRSPILCKKFLERFLERFIEMLILE